jgi:hypothetical protein
MKSFDFHKRIIDLIALDKLILFVAGDLLARYDKSLSRREPYNGVATPFLAAFY